MSSSGTATGQRHFLRCGAADAAYLIDKTWVHGSHPAHDLRRGPGADGLAGHLPFDGGSLPVYDLAPRLGQTSSGAATGRVLVIATETARWGLLVEQLFGDVRADGGAVLPLPPCLADLGMYEGVYQHDNRPVLVLTPSGLHPEGEDHLPVSAARTVNRSLPAPPVPPGRRVQQHKLLLCPVRPAEGPRRAVALGLSVAQVNEVGTPGTVIAVPGAPRHIIGITVWRNLVVPVIDPGCGAASDTPGHSPALRQVVAHAPRSLEPAAFLVRAPVHVVHLPIACAPARRPLPFEPDHVRGAFEIPDQTVVVPDLDRLVGATRAAAGPTGRRAEAQPA